MLHVDDFAPAPLDDPNGYPGRWPTGPVLITGNSVLPLEHGHPVSGRTAVIAIGPNACPAHLRRCGVGGDVILTPTVLRNHLVVYAGHATEYGAVPATVVRWVGATADVHIIWVTPEQEMCIDETESSHYQAVELPTSDGILPGYRALTGHMDDPDGNPIPIAGIVQQAATMPPALGQRAAMSLLRNRVY